MIIDKRLDNINSMGSVRHVVKYISVSVTILFCILVKGKYT